METSLGSGTLGGYAVDASDQRFAVTDYMANAWYDWHNKSKFVPYIGGGIGFATIKSTTGANAEYENSGYRVTTNDTDTVFAYQVGVGAAYEVNDNVDLTFDYRYLATTDATLKAQGSYNGSYVGTANDVKASFGTNKLLVGVRYNF